MLGSGGLKPFCETHQLTYTNVINLKNGKLKREEPRLVQRLLGTLAVPTKLLHYPPGSRPPAFCCRTPKRWPRFKASCSFSPLRNRHPGTTLVG